MISELRSLSERVRECQERLKQQEQALEDVSTMDYIINCSCVGYVYCVLRNVTYSRFFSRALNFTNFAVFLLVVKIKSSNA